MMTNCQIHREAAKAAKFHFYKNNLRALCAFAVEVALPLP